MDEVKGHIRDWPWHLVQELLRVYGPGISKLAQRGDLVSKKIIAVYKHCHRNPHDVQANRDLRDQLNDYMQRELNESARYELGSKYGHLVEEEDKYDSPSRIFVPVRQ